MEIQVVGLCVKTYQSPGDGDGFGFWNTGVFDPADVAVSPRRFYWMEYFGFTCCICCSCQYCFTTAAMLWHKVI